MENNVRITTIDNPYDPFTDWFKWYMYDMEKGYNTCSKLARLSTFREDMTDKELIDEEHRAIDRLIELDPFDIYIKKIKNKKKQSKE